MSEIVTAEGVAAWLRAFAEAVAKDRGYLTELDAAIGDADHGSNMDRGMQAVVGRIDGPSAGAAGGGVDVRARIQAQGMSERLGQPIVVDNMGGAAGMTGALRLRTGGRIEWRRSNPNSGWYVIGIRERGATGPFRSAWAAVAWARGRAA